MPRDRLSDLGWSVDFPLGHDRKENNVYGVEAAYSRAKRTETRRRFFTCAASTKLHLRASPSAALWSL